jgi:hypothetical protein
VASKNKIREKELESYMRREVERLGGRAYKWVSPGNDGVPDRIVVFPGKVRFVEMKAPGGVLRPQQELQIDWLKDKGIDVAVLSSRADIDDWLKGLSECDC